MDNRHLSSDPKFEIFELGSEILELASEVFELRIDVFQLEVKILELGNIRIMELKYLNQEHTYSN